MTIGIDTGGLGRFAKGAAGIPAVLPRTNADIVTRAALLAERDLKNIALAGGAPGRSGLFRTAKAGFVLGNRTGHAAASVTSGVFKDGDAWVGAAGSPLKYVLYNEDGATIQKAGGALALPTVNALTPAGALKNRFAGLQSLRQARDDGGKKLFVWKGKKKGTDGSWLAGTSGAGAGTVVRGPGGLFKRGGRLVLYFLLRHIVHIPARYMFRNAKRRIEPQIVEYGGTQIPLTIHRQLRAVA